MTYKDLSYFPDKPNLTFGDGDGTVNIRSLKGCLRWIPQTKVPWKIKRKQKLEYMKLYKKYRSAGLKMPDFSTFQSLVSRRFKTKPSVYHQEFPGIDHMEILRDAGVILYVKNTIGKMNFWDPKRL